LRVSEGFPKKSCRLVAADPAEALSAEGSNGRFRMGQDLPEHRKEVRGVPGGQCRRRPASKIAVGCVQALSQEGHDDLSKDRGRFGTAPLPPLRVGSERGVGMAGPEEDANPKILKRHVVWPVADRTLHEPDGAGDVSPPETRLDLFGQWRLPGARPGQG
jgi:hypothetical protein